MSNTPPAFPMDDETLFLSSLALVIGRGDYVGCSFIQRKLGIGYNSAAKQVERMESLGLISKANNVGRRELLVSDFREVLEALQASKGETQ